MMRLSLGLEQERINVFIQLFEPSSSSPSAQPEVTMSLSILQNGKTVDI